MQLARLETKTLVQRAIRVSPSIPGKQKLALLISVASIVSGIHCKGLLRSRGTLSRVLSRKVEHREIVKKKKKIVVG